MNYILAQELFVRPMLWMYFDQLQTEENLLAKVLDIVILFLGVFFMIIQGYMLILVGNPNKKERLRFLFGIGFVIWFFLEVVLSYWWCFVTGTDPIWEHTPFVIMFLGFLFSQYFALKKIGVFGSS